MAFKTDATIVTFGGKLLKLSHESKSTQCPMSLNVFLPPSKVSTSKHPVLFYLAGLTCSGDNGAEKGGFASAAAKHGIALVFPDTSPRGLNLPGEDEASDFGSGAGFYLDATQEPWSKHYRMYTYITSELPEALAESFPELDTKKMSIMGHSMGGHGALTLFLKKPGLYKSVSAFAPIANPSQCPWGEKAFKGYLGEEREKWKEYDATELVKGWKGSPLDILIDVGTGDNFLKQKQLLPDHFQAAAGTAGHKEGVRVRMQPDYDHSYFFISTFGADHVEHHAKYLC